jgi:hypothetical protein
MRYVRFFAAQHNRQPRSTRKSLSLLSLLVSVAISVTTSPAQSTPSASSPRIVQGFVKSGGVPLPGVTVTITNLATDAKLTGWSDVDGSFAVQVPDDGRYQVRVQMSAFAAQTQDIVISGTHPSSQVAIEMILLSRVPRVSSAAPRQATLTHGRGFQSLSIAQSAGGEEGLGGPSSDSLVPAGISIPGLNSSGATESVAVSGNVSNPMGNLSGDEFRQRMDDTRALGGAPGTLSGGGFGGSGAGFGGPGGGFGGPGGGGRGSGRGRGLDANRLHGSLHYTSDNSALDATPYSLTGQPNSKPSYQQNTFGATIGGPFAIPKLYKGDGKTFIFVNYNGARSRNPFDAFSTVPTLEERQGNFSDATYSSAGAGGQQAQLPVELFYPANGQYAKGGQPIPGNNFQNDPTLQINPSASALLKYIPLPNLPGSTQNFQYLTSAVTDSDDLNIRVNRSVGSSTSSNSRRRSPRNSVSIGFHYHQSFANITNPFPSVGGSTSVRSFDVPLSYTRTFGRLVNTARLDFNRSRTRTMNLYAFSQNIAGEAGIGGVSQNPFDWGIPSLSLTHFGGVQDTNPSLVRNQTLTFSDNMIWNHGKHTGRWGGDFRRIQLNTEGAGDSRGTFTFTGLNTSESINGTPVPGTGFDFADFLLGLPQQTQVQFGTNDYYFRGNSWDLYAQDEWKVRANLTLQLGVRYEYISPFTELYDHISNLDLSPGVLNPSLGTPLVSLVLPGEAGPFGGSYPESLIRPDRNNFAPRVGLAWKALSKTVIRSGYGINYNTGGYQAIAQQLAFQPPFSNTATNIQSASNLLTLQNGFPPVPQGVISNDYAVDPNYRLGYVQIRNLDIQQQIRPTLLVNVDYTGTKGTKLDVLEDPNRTATALRIPNVQAFNWDGSRGASSANAGSLRVRKRLQNGISVGGTYTFSKSLDNAPSIGNGVATASGGTTAVAQNPFDLAAERGLSSFDQRNKFVADYLWQLPVGRDRRWLASDRLLGAFFGNWQWSGDWTIASGLPFTPHILGSFSDVARGSNGTLRPDLTGQPISLSNPSKEKWFNTGAFVTPAVGSYGDARRNSIVGPGSLVFDMALTKVYTLKDNRMLEVRAQASNVFNRPQYASIDTTVDSPTFGQVTSVGAMRAIQTTARFRF